MTARQPHDLNTKEGRAAYQRSWLARKRELDPDFNSKRNASHTGWKASLPPKTKRDKYKSWDLRAYGLTLAQYDQMVIDQDNRCAICGESETKIRNGKVFELTVDHNHDTGAVRALLCNVCNRFIGLAKDSASILRAAADYLDAHSPVPA